MLSYFARELLFLLDAETVIFPPTEENINEYWNNLLLDSSVGIATS
jgi:hypothetical protein